MMLITVIVILTSSCTEFAMLSSTAGIAVSQNAYAKVYSGIDFLTEETKYLIDSIEAYVKALKKAGF